MILNPLSGLEVPEIGLEKMTTDSKYPGIHARVGHDRQPELDGRKIVSQRALFVVLLLVAPFALVLERLYISQFTVLHAGGYVEISQKPAETLIKLAEIVDSSTEILLRSHDPESSLDKQEERLLRTQEVESLDELSKPESSPSLEKHDEDKLAETLDQPNEAELSPSLEKRKVKKLTGTLDEPNEPESSSSLQKQEEDKPEETLDESNEPESSSPLDKQEEEIDFKQRIDFSVGDCNIWRGEWIPHSSEPAYTNASCQFIQGHQNCLKNGRPDHRYLYWKWKPYDCELPLFDAKKFLKLVRGKAWAFAGDSISRNHFQSFLCFLAQVETPENLYRDEKDHFVRWLFPSYKFTLAVFWSPFLVEATEDEVHGFSSNYQKIFLDHVDNNWASSLSEFDYVVLSLGQWFLKSSVYFLKNEVIGCHYCPELNLTQVGFYFGFQTALRTVFDFLASNYHGVVFFRTFTPDHFENGQWNDGGHCIRTTPYRNATIEGVVEEMYKIQLEEFGRTLHLNRHISARFKVADTIHASLLRPDGHPGPYRNVEALSLGKNGRIIQDCLHWCLPGAIDTWSAMLLEMLTQL